MNHSIAALVGVALLATSFAFPISEDIDPSIGYKRELLIGNVPVRLGLSWAKDRTVAAQVIAGLNVNGIDMPIGAAIETSLDKPGESIKYQLNGKMNTVGASVTGDLKGDLAYTVDAFLPIQNDLIGGVGLGVEVDKTKPTAVLGTIVAGGESITATVGLDKDYKPESVNVVLGA